MRLHRWSAALLLLAVLVSGCADSGDSSGDNDGDRAATPSVAPTPTNTDVPEGSCGYLNASEVTNAVGRPMIEETISDSSCTFSPAKGKSPTITLQRTELVVDQADYAAGAREVCAGEPTDVDAGQEAFICVTTKPSGNAFFDGVSIYLEVDGTDYTDADPEGEGLRIAAELLPHLIWTTGPITD